MLPWGLRNQDLNALPCPDWVRKARRRCYSGTHLLSPHDQRQPTENRGYSQRTIPLRRSLPLSKIAVAGVNYVGLVTAACFADLGNEVVGIEIMPEKVAALRQGRSPIYEPGLEELLQRNLKAGRITFTSDYAE